MPVFGKTRREVLTEFRRAEILAAARKVFANKGFREATLDGIAAQAGVAKGTLYLYFANKEEIFWAAIRSRKVELQEQIRRQMDQVQGAREKIRAALRVRFEFMRSDQEFLRIYFSEFGELCLHTGPNARKFRDLYLDGARLLAPVIAEGVRTGEFRDLPPLETAMALIDLIRSTVALAVLGLHQKQLNLEQFVFDLFWQGARAEGQPQRQERENS